MALNTGHLRKVIDWNAARERLVRAQAAVEQALNPSPEHAKRIMEERARALARRPADARPAGERISLVTFALANEWYAIETRYVREVTRLADLTPVPGTPAYVLGVANFRSAILAIIDLGRFFGLARKESTDRSRMIVLGTESPEFGVLADESRGQVECGADEVVARSERATGVAREFLRGVTKDALIVLDGQALLTDERLLLHVGRAEGPAKPSIGDA